MFYCGTSLGVGDSLGISTGVGLLVWVSGLVLVFFFSFSFHSIERKLPERNSQHVLQLHTAIQKPERSGKITKCPFI